jgi:alkyl sulfatase BDS1-like metallo-beta-lactamase superfamily hydrolase
VSQLWTRFGGHRALATIEKQEDRVKFQKTETASAATTGLAQQPINVATGLPPDLAEALEKKWGDLSQYALEILALEGYRSGALTPEQLHCILSLKRRP